MIDDSIREFSTRIGVDIYEFSIDKPLCFRVDRKYHYCLEYRKGQTFSQGDYMYVEEPLVLTLKVEIPPYDQETLTNFLKHSSVFSVNKIPYKVGYSNDNIYLMTDISLDATAADLENAIILLKKQYEEVVAP